MKKVLFVAILLSIMSLAASAQDAVNKETKVWGTCYYTSYGIGTASGDRINAEKVRTGEHRWVALSLDLYRMGYRFNDTIVVKSTNCDYVNGLWVVKDKMGHSRCMDFLIHKSNVRQFRNGHVTIRKMRPEERANYDAKGRPIK